MLLELDPQQHVGDVEFPGLLGDLLLEVLLGEEQDAGGLLLGRDVQGREHDPRGAVSRVDGRGAQVNVDDGSVLATPARFDGPLAPGFHLCLFLPPHPLELLLVRVQDAGALALELVGVVPRQRGDALVDPLQGAVVHHAHADGCRLQNAPQQGLVLAQGLLDRPELGDVRDDARRTRHAPVLDDGPSHVEPEEPAPVFPQHGVLEAEGRAFADPRNVAGQIVQRLGGDDLREPDALFDLVGAEPEHVQSRAVRVDDAAVQGRLVDPRRHVVGQFAVARLARPEGLLGLFLLRHVEGRHDDPFRRVLGEDGRHAQQHVDRRSVLSRPAGIRRPDSVPLDPAEEIRPHAEELLVAVVQDPGGVAFQLLPAVSGHPLVSFVDPLQGASLAEGDPDRGRLQNAAQHGLVFPQGALRLFEGADVRADPPGPRNPAVCDDGPRRDESREPAPVLSRERVLLDDEGLLFTDAPGIGQGRGMLLGGDNPEEIDAPRRRQLFGLEPEHLPGRLVGVHDVAAPVRLVDAHGDRVGQFPVALFACAQGLFGPDALGDVADDPPDAHAILGKMDRELHDLERLPLIPFVRGERFPRLEDLPVRLPAPLGHRRRQQLRVRLAEDFLLGSPRVLAHGTVQEDVAALLVLQKNVVPRRVDEGSEQFLAAPDFFRSLPLIRHVAQDAADADPAILQIHPELCRFQDPVPDSLFEAQRAHCLLQQGEVRLFLFPFRVIGGIEHFAVRFPDGLFPGATQQCKPSLVHEQVPAIVVLEKDRVPERIEEGLKPFFGPPPGLFRPFLLRDVPGILDDALEPARAGIDPGVTEHLDPSLACPVGAHDGLDARCGFPRLHGHQALAVLAGILAAVIGLVALPARKGLDMGEPFFHRLVDAQDRHVGRRNHDPVLDGVENPGQESFLVEKVRVGLPQGLFLLLPLDGGAEDFGGRPEGGDLVLRPLDVAGVVGKPDEPPPALPCQDGHDGNREFLVQGQFPDFPVGELPDCAVNRPALALPVHPPRKAHGQLRVAQELPAVPGAVDLRGAPFVAVADGDLAVFPDLILAEKHVGGVHGGAESLEDPLDPVSPGGALEKPLGSVCHSFQDGGPFLQDVLRVLSERDVPAHGLILQDVSAVVEKSPVGPLIPEDIAEHVLHTVLEGVDGALRPKVLQAGIDLFAVRLGNGQKDVPVLQLFPFAAEVAAVGFVDVGQGAVGTKTADELRLVRLARSVRRVAARGRVRLRADLVERPLGENGVSRIVLDILDHPVEPSNPAVTVENRVVAL